MKKTYVAAILCLLCISSFVLNLETHGSQVPIIKKVPSSEILITTDADFKNYNFTGTGAPTNPYMIENLYFSGLSAQAITITNTTAYFKIKDCIFQSNTNGAIYISNVANGTAYVQDNSIYTSSGYTLSIVNSTSAYVEGTYGQASGGFYVSECANSTFYYNALASMSSKFFIIDSPNCNFTHNSAQGSHMAPGSGFRFERCDNLHFNENAAVFNAINGVILVDSNNCLIQTTYLDYNNGWGIFVLNSNNVVLSLNMFIGGNLNKICIQNCYNITAVKNKDSTSFYFQDCSLDQMLSYTFADNVNMGDPIYYFKNLNDVELNNFMDVGQLILVNCSEIIISNIQIKPTALCLFVGYSNGITITRSFFHDGVYGNYIVGCEDVTITNNYYYGFYGGVKFEGTSTSSIRYNEFRENSIGLYLDFSSANNSIHHNIFMNNYQQAEDWGINNLWYDVENLEGNYWSNLGGADHYTIFGLAGSVDLFPLNYLPEIKEYPSTVLVLAMFTVISTMIIPLKRKRKKRIFI